MNPLRILLRDAKVETLMQAIPAERLRALILEQTDGRLDLLLSQPDPETRVDAHGDPEWDEHPNDDGPIDVADEAKMQAAKDATAEQATKAKAARARKPKLNDTNARLKAMADEAAATTPEDLAAVRELLSGDLIGIAQVAACLGWPDDEKGYARAGNALCHLRDVDHVAESVDHDDPAAGGLKFRGGTGKRLRCGYDGKVVDPTDATPEPTEPPAATEPARGDDSPASEADVLGALLEGAPQTISQIASYLELGVARVTPTLMALVNAGKVERAPTKGRYPQWQKVAS